MSNSSTTLASAAWPGTGGNVLLRNIVLAVAGSALIAICAKIQVPMWPVPMTMQVFAVLLIGLAYGARLGFATVALYLAEGAIGLPVFASGGGFAYLAGPTGGFLLGFPIAAFLAGWLAERGWGRPVLQVFLASVLGIALIYAIGVPWLANFFATAKGMVWSTALATAFAKGMTPFLVGDLVKAALAAAILPAAWKLVSKGGS
ncbi:MAG: biotin transporter BioY [Hyphomicrobiaceae bacterium]